MLRAHLDRFGSRVASSVVCALVLTLWPETGLAQTSGLGHTRAAAAEHHAKSPTCEKKARKRTKSSAAASERREARKAKRLARQEAKRERAAKKRGKSGATALPDSPSMRDLARERELQKERELDQQLAAANELRSTTQPEPVTDAEPETENESECEGSDSATCVGAELTATLGVYTGFTSRSITLPTIAGLATLDTGMLPSLAIQVGALAPGDAFFGVTFGYQSSLGAEARQAPSDPLKPALSTSIQSHHFEGGVLGGFHFDGPQSATLGLFAGYGVRALASVVELRVPRFSLHGPVARLELELPLGAPWIVLRVAPEMQVVLAMSEDLRTLGVGSPIWAFGGEAGLRVRVSQRVAFQLSFREAHAVVASIYGGSFEDVERYGLFGLVVSYL